MARDHRRLVRLCAVLALGLLAACATVRPGPPAGHGPAHGVRPAEQLRPESFRDLPDWAAEDHAQAFLAFRAGCPAARDPAMVQVCRRAMTVDLLDEPQARAFFEDNFQPERVAGEGVLTAYFAPEYEGRTAPDGEFSAPVRARPADLVLGGDTGKEAFRRLGDGSLVPYPDRAWIEAHGPPDALAWMRPEELFFLQVQGSGVLTLPDGRRLKLVYAGNNGQPFRGIANLMRDQGLLAATDTGGEAIRAWLAAHRGPEADAVMRLNPRFAFFRALPDDGLPPVGAAGVALPAGRAIAIDPAWHGMGELWWIDGTTPLLAGAWPTYRRLVTALDTGGAIKGEVRADLYLGQGPAAGAEAGRVRHVLHLHRLVPKGGR